jgi:tetrahydromethanopterin S-methyltransferase subunit C
MPDTSKDPVDHARTYRQHAGETLKSGVNAPGVIAVGLGVLSVVIGLFSFANGARATGVVATILAVLLFGGGLGWLALRHRKVQEQQVDWHKAHPDAHYEPPTS